MVDEDNKRDFYQSKAEELRRAAERVRQTGLRLQLLSMARTFERLAAKVWGAERERAAAD